MNRFPLLALTAAVLFVPLSARAQPRESGAVHMQQVYDLFYKNEESMAWLKHCQDMKFFLDENPYFVKNVQSTALALAEALVSRQRESLDLEQATDLVLKRQEQLSLEFEKVYKKQGCNNVAAIRGQRHFESLRAMQPLAFRTWLNNMAEEK